MRISLTLLFILAVFVLSFSQQTHIDSETSLPPQYDLRTYGYVTPVKDQGNCGCCWAFATMAAIESNWLMQGYGTYDLSEDNLINCQNYDNSPCYGGNFYMSSSMFGKHAGPVDESLDPYGDTTAIKNCPTGPFGGLPPTAYVPDVRFLPNDINTIKQALQDHGAVATTMMFDMGSYNPANYTYLFNGTGGYPHCITVVGWDDNMSTASANPGAWIIKDSYGTSWANAGYFYISYDDPVIFTETAIFPQRYPVLTGNTTYVYYYDEFGWITNVGFSTTTAYSLVHYYIGETAPDIFPQQVKRIGTYAVEANTDLEIEVYENFDGTNLTGLRFQTTYNCEFAGFYTIPVNLGSDTIGTDVYIRVKYETPSTILPVPVEAYEANYTSSLMLQTGRNWMSGDGSTWHAVGNNTNWSFDLCVKMYTETAPLSDFIMQDTAVIGEPVQLISDCFPQEMIDSLQWFSNGVYIGSEPVIQHIFNDPGDNEVSLTAFMGSNSDTETKSIYIKDPAIVSIYPNIMMQGDDFTAYIAGHETSWAGSPQVSMSFSSNPSEVITAGNVIATGPLSVEADFDIPINASVGNWDVHVDDLVMEDGFYVDILWNISEEDPGKLNIFPIPTQGKLMIVIFRHAEMEVVGTDGTVICRRDLRKGSNAVDLGQLDAGIFFLRIRTDSETLFRKLVKQ